MRRARKRSAGTEAGATRSGEGWVGGWVRAWVGGFTLLLLTACAHLGPTPDEALRAAFRAQATSRTLGVAALVELDRGQAEAAQALVQRASGADEPALLLARLLLCKRNLDVPCQRGAATRLLERFPGAPTSAIASSTLQRLVGESLAQDEELRADLTRILAAAPERLPDLECQHRLRDALATLSIARGDHAAAQRERDRSGLLQDWEILGPLSSYHYLEFDTPLGPELGVETDRKLFPAPWSPKGAGEGWRPLRMNNGQIPLGHALELDDSSGEDGRGRGPQGDLVYLRTSVTAAGGGIWLRVESSASLQLFLDGKPVLERDLFRRVLPRVQWLEVPARNGPHRLLVKAAVGEVGRSLRIEAVPLSSGARPPSATGSTHAQEAFFGAALGQTLAALGDADLDPHGALAELQASRGASPELGALGLGLRAALWGTLDTLTDDDAHGRSQRDLDSWIARDPASPEARLRRAQVLAELNRLPVAQQDLDAIPRPPAAILVAKARIQMQRDAIPLAIPALRRVLARDPGDCAALELLLSADDQANAFAETEGLSERQASCPGGAQARAQFLARTEGPKPLVAYWRGRVERSPGDPEAALQLSEVLLAAGDAAGALQALETRLRAWPGDGAALRRKATLADLLGGGTIADARPGASWQRLLDREPADLTLRRALALLAGQPEPLEELVPPVAPALAEPRWVSRERAPSATLLDSGAAWLHLDGTVTERVRTLEIPLDENALGPLGELELPPGAALLALRTHKADGRILDADAQVSGEKHTISASSLEVGDLLEIDYLMATPPPRRGRGGAAEAFYFTAGDTSLQRSIYAIEAEGEAGAFEIDSHRVDAPKTVKQVVRVERTRVDALPDEPSQPPQSEFYPWVQAGSGDTVSDLARSVADQVLDKIAVDEGLAALIAEVRAEPARDDSQRAALLWRKLSDRIRVEGGTLAEAASEVVGRGSGDLVLPMRAALNGLSIPSHLILVAGPALTHEVHRFARLADYGDVMLRIEPHDGQPVFLAASVRDAPFGRVPPNLCGSRALVLPNDDSPGEEIRLPACLEKAGHAGEVASGPDDHLLELQLALAPDGSAEGFARETLSGFEAAALRSSIEQLDDDQRRQGVESALAAVFTGVALTDLNFELGKGPGAPLAVSYHFRVPDLADRETGDRWSFPLRGFPAQLQERFAQLASRKLPLLIPAGERPRLELTLRLPPGGKLEDSAPAEVWLDGPFGSYLRRETRQGPGTLSLSEKLVLPPQRVSPAQYPDFASFAQQVDGAQAERVRFRMPAFAPTKKPLALGSRAL